MKWAASCPVCAGEINADNVLSRGWLDPKRVFGCPHCETFFDVPHNPFEYAPNLLFSIVGVSCGLIAIALHIFDAIALPAAVSWASLIGLGGLVLMNMARVARFKRQFREITANLRPLPATSNEQVAGNTVAPAPAESAQ